MPPVPGDEIMTGILGTFDGMEANEGEEIDADAMDQLLSAADQELDNGHLDSLISEEEDEEKTEPLTPLESVHAKADEISYEDDEQMIDEDDNEEENDEEDDEDLDDEEEFVECNDETDEMDPNDDDDKEDENEDTDETGTEENVTRKDEEGSGDVKRRGRPRKSLTSNDQSAIEASPIRSRRPSRNCRPNSLIFTADTTTLTPITRKRKRGQGWANRSRGRPPITSTPARNASTNQKVSGIKSDIKPTVRVRNGFTNSSLPSTSSAVDTSPVRAASTGRPVRLASRRTSYQDMVKKAVSTVLSSHKTNVNSIKNDPRLYTLDGKLKKRMGRPRKYPVPVDGQVSISPPKSPWKGNKLINHQATKAKVHPPGHKKGQSPPVKLSPFLAAILSGQSLGETKNGRPKGRPRVLPTLDEAVLNGSATAPGGDGLPERRSLRKCDCESKYRTILVNLEESLECKFAESTQKVNIYKFSIVFLMIFSIHSCGRTWKSV